MATKIRRHDLDWLRVLVFGLLIFYHVGMFFVPWGWHIKNNILYEWLTYPMLFVNQWRLSILFVISGMGTYYALSFRDGKVFAWERIKRLGLPLVIGILFIVPPQVYIERIAQGQFAGTYFQYLSTQAFAGIYPSGNFSWHHLWFLPYLLVFSLLLIPLFISIRKNPESAFISWLKATIQKPLGLLIFLIPLYLCEALLEPFFPVTHALIGDWFTFINFLFLFFTGFLCISLGEVFWKAVDQSKQRYLIVGICSFIILNLYWNVEDGILVHFTEAFFKVLNTWSWIIVIFGYAAHYLNQPSKLLTYSNTAVYPFYILHQTITVCLGFYVMNLSWNFLAKFCFLSLGTFLISFLLYEFLIRRVSFLRPLFGLKG